MPRRNSSSGKARAATQDEAGDIFHWLGPDLKAVDLAALGFQSKNSEPGRDHAESIAFLDEARTQLIIAYAPSSERIDDGTRVAADVIAWR